MAGDSKDLTRDALGSRNSKRADNEKYINHYDYLCRLQNPNAENFLHRALVRREVADANWHEDALIAAGIDPLSPAIHSCVVAADRGGGIATLFDREKSAECIVADPRSSNRDLVLAGAILREKGRRYIARVSGAAGRLSGWIAWQPPATLVIQFLQGTSCTGEFLIQPNASLDLAKLLGRAELIDIAVPAGSDSYDIILDGERVGSVSLDCCETPGRIRLQVPTPRENLYLSPRHPAGSRETVDTISVVLPVFDDFEATKASIEAARAACTRFGHARLIVVDDAARDSRISAYVDELAEAGRLTVIRNQRNLGFVRSVDQALSEVPHDDSVLLLNADAFLPEDALVRLSRVARIHAGIGTITPLSNNGEHTSFPVMGVANPQPDAVVSRKIDQIARDANGTEIMDIPTGTGFCLYITSECRRAVGGLSAAYHRGYYEDVDFCLRAHATGFRNVCATGIFVPHIGGCSFGSEKRALVKRNQPLLLQRFPEFEGRTSAFLAADPLAPARRRIEQKLMPQGYAALLIADLTQAESLQRAQHLKSQKADILLLSWVEAPRGSFVVRLSGLNGGWPQSLRYEVSRDEDEGDLRTYLAAAKISDLHVAPGSRVPGWLSKLLQSIELGMQLSGIDGIRIESPVKFPAGTDPATSQGQRRQYPHITREGSDHGLNLGIVMPLPHIACGPLLSILAGMTADLGGKGRSLVVFGHTHDDRYFKSFPNVLVIGRALPEEYQTLRHRYDVGAWLLPCRFGKIEDVRALVMDQDLPLACFAQQRMGASQSKKRNLCLDAETTDRAAADQIATWWAACTPNQN